MDGWRGSLRLGHLQTPGLSLFFPGFLTTADFLRIKSGCIAALLCFGTTLLNQVPEPLEEAAQHGDHDDDDLHRVDFGKQESLMGEV